MNKDIKSLKPELLWKHFAAMCAIPHPSGHEEKIRDYVVAFAKEHGLECVVDEGNNVIVRKPATPGMENLSCLTLQSHLDMVPQKNGDKVFDFEKDPIEAYIDGEWVTANGTTLGADNAIGAAATLAVLESKDLRHGPVEGLFTATEETGMDGAFNLRANELKGDILLNLDTEEWGELCVGCAGGLDANITFDYTADKSELKGHKALSLEVKGLRGGHSGTEINLQRGNANKLMFRFLRMAWERYDMQLASIDGGGLRNAIPREAVAKVYVPAGDVERFKSDVAAYEKVVAAELDGIEDSLTIKAVDAPADTNGVIPKDAAMRLTRAVCGCPNGVISMSMSMHGLVQTSTNLARVVSDGSQIKLQALMRSSVDSEKEALAGSMSSVFELAGAQIQLRGGYSGWKPNMKSPILKAMRELYKKMYGKEVEVRAVHAGLECGIIGGKYPKMDMISFGPTINFPHSPDEKVNIASVEKFWDFLKAILENAPARA
jgi:dipeptidase D